MYDFYGNPPKSKSDILDYLQSWLQESCLQDCSGNHLTVTHNNAQWVMTNGFRRAFHFHQVFKNQLTNEYGFNVDEKDWSGNDSCNMGVYPTFNDMLEGVTEKYAKLWKIQQPAT